MTFISAPVSSSDVGSTAKFSEGKAARAWC